MTADWANKKRTPGLLLPLSLLIIYVPAMFASLVFVALRLARLHPEPNSLWMVVAVAALAPFWVASRAVKLLRYRLARVQVTPNGAAPKTPSAHRGAASSPAERQYTHPPVALLSSLPTSALRDEITRRTPHGDSVPRQ